MEANTFKLLFVCVFYLAVFPTIRANKSHLDRVWHRRALEAKKAAREAFRPNPESVWRTWNWRSEGDLMMNGAFFIQSGKKVANPPKTDITAKPGAFAARLTRFAGPLKCTVKKPC